MDVMFSGMQLANRHIRGKIGRFEGFINRFCLAQDPIHLAPWREVDGGEQLGIEVFHEEALHEQRLENLVGHEEPCGDNLISVRGYLDGLSLSE